MRIIAGKFRGRKILPPGSTTTRPITDRAKQSLFDILSPRLEGTAVYDCFAGTGSLGLESLSRGCRSATFFESDRSAVKLLRENLRTLNLTDRSTIVSEDIFQWAAGAPASPGPIDVIFLDPPYAMNREKPDSIAALAAFLATQRLAPGGIIVFRHDVADNVELPGLRRYDRRDYGAMTIELLTHP
jgi:16S rRNA (guanine966-N2)-methyltransferase